MSPNLSRPGGVDSGPEALSTPSNPSWAGSSDTTSDEVTTRTGGWGAWRRLNVYGASNHIVLIVLLIALCAYFYANNALFVSVLNVQNLASQGSVLVMMAMGQLFVILAGGLDLSVGAQVSLLSLIAVRLSLAVPLGLALLITVFVASLIGVVNGLMVTRANISPIIATLAMWQVLVGSVLVWTHGLPARNFSSSYGVLGSDNIGPFPIDAVLALAVFLVAWFVLTRARFGRYTYAVGGNAEAARLSGINIRNVTVWTYVVCSLFTALAAIALSSRVGSGLADLGSGLEVTTIAAVFIGGVRWGGGAGSAIGVLLGALLLSVISNGFDLTSISSDTQTIVTGVLIALSVGLAGLKGRRTGA